MKNQNKNVGVVTSNAVDKVLVVPLSGNDSIWEKSVYGVFYDAGNIDIGTTNPGPKLAVTSLSSGTDDSVVNGTLAGALYITNTNNLYIDTEKLTIKKVRGFNNPVAASFALLYMACGYLSILLICSNLIYYCESLISESAHI